MQDYQASTRRGLPEREPHYCTTCARTLAKGYLVQVLSTEHGRPMSSWQDLDERVDELLLAEVMTKEPTGVEKSNLVIVWVRGEKSPVRLGRHRR
jgi:hypothetical protein